MTSAVPPASLRPPLPIGKANSLTFRPFTPGEAQGLDGEGWRLERPLRHTIGWFDLSRNQEGELPGEGGEGSDGAMGGSLNSPENDFLRRLAATLQPPLSALYAPHGVLDWPSPLMPYQREGVATLLANQALLLADDMGLGKTITAIAALRILFLKQEIEAALVVCPASLMVQWQRELMKWAPELRAIVITGNPSERGSLWRVPAHLRLISYETLRADVLDIQESPALRKPWGVVILDEASRIKNRDTGIAIACKRLPRLRRWALTGTPLENRIEDIISLIEFLRDDPDSPPGQSWTPETILPELRRLQLRRKKEDVLPDLPPKQVNELILELPPAQQEAYDRAEREGIFQLTTAGASVTITHVLELISRLKQICNYDPASGESAKLADIAQRLRTLVAAGHRALVFSQFTDDNFGIGRAADYLKEFRPLEFTGSLSVSQRSAVITRFMEDTRYKALLLSLRAGGVGLNLQAASYVFHLDRWWNPAIEEQADSRAHRMGQTYPVTIYRYICARTIEERIDAKLKAKRQLFQEVVDDVSLDIGSALSEQELFGLFGLSTPRPRRP